MVTFPARKIIDIRIYNRLKGVIETILYHNEDYHEELTVKDIEHFHIKFNLYDVKQKIYISKERNFDETRQNIINLNLKIVRLETVADAKIISDYDYNNIWKSL